MRASPKAVSAFSHRPARNRPCRQRFALASVCAYMRIVLRRPQALLMSLDWKLFRVA